MTKKRDRYVSGFDGKIPGVQSADYDVMLVLMLLERFAKAHGLMDEQVSFDHSPSWTIQQLLSIGNAALNESISPALDVYKRLQQNAEAARLMSDAWNHPRWRTTAVDMERTLDDCALVARRHVTQARRDLAKKNRVTIATMTALVSDEQQSEAE